jgi:magnesium transporter
MTEPVENLSISDQLAQRFLTQHLGEATSYLESLSPDAAASALQSVPPESIIPVWEYLSTGFGSLVFPLLATERQIALLEGLDRSIAARIAGTMPESARNDTLARLDDGTAEQIRLLLSYPEDTAGRLMDTHVFALRGTVTAGRAVEMVRQRGRGDAISIKAVDADNRLIGLVDLRDIAFSDPEKPLSELTTGVAAVVNAMDPRSAVVEKFQEFDVQEMPVIDLDGHVLGVIRHNQLLDALRTDASPDIQTMVGASRDERALSTSWFAIRKRLPWLQINLLTAFLAASVVGIFESTIATYTALAVLLPVVAGQSGNAGA